MLHLIPFHKIPNFVEKFKKGIGGQISVLLYYLMSYLEKQYIETLSNWTDIQKHMPLLREYATKCDHITELGTDDGTSTWAFLSGLPKVLHTYDIAPCPNEISLKLASEENNIQFYFHRENTLEVEIEPTDLLFIDSLHTYTQVFSELNLHADKVSKYIIAHDINMFGRQGGGGTLEQISTCPHYLTKGVLDAVEEFLDKTKNWEIVYKDLEDPYGLIILKRLDN